MPQFPFLSSAGLVLNRHQRDSWAAESGEALPRLQVLPVPLSGDGRGEAWLGQGAAAGRDATGRAKTRTERERERRAGKLRRSRVSFVSRSIRSWSWPSLCPASLRSSWRPRRPWGVTAKLLSPPPSSSSLKNLKGSQPSCSSAALTYAMEERRRVFPATFNWWTLCLLPPLPPSDPQFPNWRHAAVSQTGDTAVGVLRVTSSQIPDLLSKNHFHVASQHLFRFCFLTSSWLNLMFFKLFRHPFPPPGSGLLAKATLTSPI